MGKSTVNLVTPVGVFDRTQSIKQDVDMFSVRLNYTFGGPVVREILSSGSTNLQVAAIATHGVLGGAIGCRLIDRGDELSLRSISF